MWWIVFMVVALGAGIYVGLGAPGVPGRGDRIVAHGRAKRLPHRYVHWLRQDHPRRR